MESKGSCHEGAKEKGATPGERGYPGEHRGGEVLEGGALSVEIGKRARRGVENGHYDIDNVPEFCFRLNYIDSEFGIRR